REAAQAARGREPPAEADRRRPGPQPPGAERRLGKQVVTTRARRQVVRKLRAAYHISERRALRFTGFARSSARYRSVREPQDALRAAIREIAGEKPRWGYRFIHDRLRERGWIEPKACAATLSAREPRGTPTGGAQALAGPAAGTAGTRASEPALEHGFHERRAGQRT